MSTTAAQTSATTWTIDLVHSIAEFKVKHMMVTNVKGQFTPITGVLTLEQSDLTKSRVEATVEAASINTRDGCWTDMGGCELDKNVIYVRRSIVKQRIGPPKTEASQKPIPVNDARILECSYHLSCPDL
ncbi:MAG TPA: YceI family protein [Pyrinomonadaceae bacterium]|nr:YceI family protein [Pyrinomonadaceae bacterium]